MAIKLLKKSSGESADYGNRWTETIRIDSEPHDIYGPDAWGDVRIEATGPYRTWEQRRKKPDKPSPDDPIWIASWDESDDIHRADWRAKGGMTKSEAVSFAQAHVREMVERRRTRYASDHERDRKPGL